MPNHATSQRLCPGCNKVKEFDTRAKSCSVACSRTIKARENAAAKAAQQPAVVQIDQMILDRMKGKGAISIDSLADEFDRGPKVIREALERLKVQGYNFNPKASKLKLEPVIQAAARTPSFTHDLREYEGKYHKFGVCGDKHLGNMHSRLDVLKLLYDVYESEGITTVYDTGNWIDGECRFNKSELIVHGMDAQINYLIDNHPRKPGMTTYAVAGDDHEGWYQQRECLEIGKYAELKMSDAGRGDFKYLGYAEALVELKAAKGSRMMMVNHPGGGASYAISYKGQKYVEMLQGGEKPAVILQGHYHKANYSYPREVHVVDTGTTCDQTLFMRKRQLAAHVGGWIIELMQAPDGRITRFKAEFLPFYDRSFYEDSRRRFGLPSKLRRTG